MNITDFSIPSPKAEPFKMWLAMVGKERIDETIDPELTIDRALETYLKKGYSRRNEETQKVFLEVTRCVVLSREFPLN